METIEAEIILQLDFTNPRSTLLVELKPDQPETTENFVKIIRQRRKALGLNQTELAGLCGITKEGLSRIERGEVQPKLLTILKLIKILSGVVEIRWK